MGETLNVDYLVIGAGAMGMAFVDALVSDTQATIALVDRYDRPGGHWTLAYPYVRLHQPSAFYGVNSRHLGQDKIDTVGWNKGLAELATVDEVCAYYSSVMQQTLLPSGRVSYFPKHQYLGEGRFRSIITHTNSQVGENTRIVDATCMKVKVPAMAPPAYRVAKDVELVTPNDLTKLQKPYQAYTVVGGGKTGVDACLWLLTHGIDPMMINWIIPRDAWMFERGGLQPGPSFAQSTAASVAAVNESIMLATSPEDCFLRLESAVQMVRLDREIWPTMFRCCTISIAELEQVRKIGTIIRKGRILQIEAGKVTLEKGTYKLAPDTLFVDCTADPLAKLAPTPIFQGRQINLQSVRYCQQVFSAAFIAHVEATYQDEKLKNELCQVVPHPYQAIDYLIVTLQSHRNGRRWAAYPKTAAWLARARLDWFGTLMPPPPEEPAEAAEFYKALAGKMEALCSKLEQLVSQGYRGEYVESYPEQVKL